MEFANPAALWLLLLVPVPLLLSRRSPRERRVVSNLYLWRDAMLQTEAQVARPRRHPTWLVLVQMACIGVAVLWLARPAIFVSARRTAFVFDVSASMGARTAGTTRLDAARAQARSIVGALPRSARARVILAGGSARVVGEWSASDARLLSAIDGLTPAAGSADVTAAIELARGSRDVDHIIVFSDTSRAAADDDSFAVQWVRLGTAVENAAVTRLAVERTAIGGRAGQAVIGLRHYGTTPRDVDVEISVDDRAVSRQRIRLLPFASRTLHVELPDVGRYVTARLLEEDALPIDDARSIAVRPPSMTRVALIGPRGSFLERALTVNPSLSVRTYDRGARVTDIVARHEADVLVCEGCNVARPVAIPSLIVASSSGESVRDVMRVVNVSHPVAASLESVPEIATARSSVAPAQPRDVVLRVGGTAAVTVADGDEARRVDVHLDLTAPDFVLSPAFPILIANSVEWLAAQHALPLDVTAGEPLAFSTLSGERAVEVLGPDGVGRNVRHVGHRFVVGDTDAAGQYRIRVDGSEHLVAINPDVGSESNLTEANASVRAQFERTDHPPRTRAEIDHGLALLAAGLLALEWWLRRRKGAPFDGRHAVWRAATIVLAIVAAAGFAIPAGNGPVSVLVALDRSASIPPHALEQALTRLTALRSTMRPADQMGVVSFGATAALEWRPADATHQGAVHTTVTDSGTNIGAALRLARAVLPQSGSRRILLVSDGRDDAGDAEREALHAAAAGIPVDVVPIDADDGSPLHVRRLSAPRSATTGEPYKLSIEIGGAPAARGTVVVYRNDEIIGRHTVTASNDGTVSVAVTEQHDAARPYVYRAAIDSDDRSEARSVGAVVMVEGQPAILYVCESPGTIRQPLTRAGFRVIATAPAAVPTTAAGFASIAGVVLDDVPAERLPSAAIDALTAYVERAGGGLLILGSPRTLTLDGYPATTLGRVLPIDLRPRSGQRAVPVEIMLLFDKSGSMADVVGGTSKIEIARQAVAQAVQLVPESDAVGVLAFDSRVETVTPLAPHPDAPALRTALERIRPGGSTAIAPALETALQSFRAAGRPANTRRHVILISDGRTSDADAARLMTLATTGVAQISAVAIGSQANQALLETLARTSGGRAYFPENLQDLPRMVAREAVRSSAGGIVEEPFTPRVFRHPVLEGLDANALPSLNGYVVSAAKPSATVILSSHLEDPILTAWRAGLGRVAVFTADLASAWSVRLRSSPDGGQLWRQTVRWLSRRDHDEALRLTLADAAGGPRLHVDAEGAEGEVVPLTIVAATVTPPDGSAIDVTLEPSAPGRYDAPLPFDGAGSYVVALTAVAETSGTEHRLVRTLYWSADREMHTRGADVPFLSRLASLSGGRLLAADGSPFEVPRVTAYADASTWLAATVLAMFILELTLLRHLLTKRRAVHA